MGTELIGGCRTMESVPSNLVKTYPPRGPLQQFRFAESTVFRCFRCGATKKSKLITICSGDESKRLCNGCYGLLLSLYEVKAGTAPEDERAEALGAALLTAVALEDQRQAERLFRASERRAELLSPGAVRFVATAEHVAGRLESDPQLEWSPAVIGLCKAVEAEVVAKVLLPLAECGGDGGLVGDKGDKDIGRVAAFCMDTGRKPPELGAFAHFLQTAIHSQSRRGTSVLLGRFLRLAREWSGSSWLLDSNGLHRSLAILTDQFRNRAAHIDELGRQDYLDCRALVIGGAGVLWLLLDAVQRHK
jgi:hypothetical protein